MIYCCISFDSYIKPQPGQSQGLPRLSCISFDSYIKPQLQQHYTDKLQVVYLLIPTSNHNGQPLHHLNFSLYIFWFLHQTTTCTLAISSKISCISFDSYIKPQPTDSWHFERSRCISFDSYIKPQHAQCCQVLPQSCISFDSYIKPQRLWILEHS